MSIFQSETLTCPVCAADVPFEVAYSVNADQRPDLREQILDGVFQRTTCGSCSSVFRLDPKLTLLDAARGQWIAARPAGELEQWRRQVDIAAAAFGRVKAVLPPQVTPRVTFGWAALREKLFIHRCGMDDVTVELVKIALLRSRPQLSLSVHRDLRLVEVKDRQTMMLAWIDEQSRAAGDVLAVPRALYTEISAAPASWAALAEALSAEPFVDAKRLMLAD